LSLWIPLARLRRLWAAPAGAAGEAWRNGRPQADLARLLGSDSCEIVPLDNLAA